MTIKRLILNDNDNRQYFILNKNKWYFDEISSNGYNLTMFTNCGYFGQYKLISVEYGINDFAILEKVEE